MILGDVDSAKVVLSAHYDTCAWLPFPNLITPKNIIAYILYSLAIVIPIVTIGFGLNVLLNLFIDNFWINYFISLAFYLFVVYMMLAGPANRHTVNDNTSGVVTLCELYQAMDERQKTQVAIVFFDKSFYIFI